MSKGFFIGIIVALFAGVGLLSAMQLGILPSPIYSFLYQMEMSIPFFNTSIPPYLQKFEGNWMMTLTSKSTESDLGSCTTNSGLIHVHKGVFLGTIGPLGSAFTFNASTTEDGALSGTFGGTTVRMGMVQATLTNGAGDGTWSDNYNCSGTVSFQKQDPVIDPVQGRIVSENGAAELLRGSRSEALFPGLMLYAGDAIITQDGTALLGLGADFGTPITVSANTTYKVGQ